ncbi:MAG: helix-turn-helix domain-containing protein [Deltaproteobacteria bacterium]|jgi:transcriptional regulator with XRE-family HTH domain|nr:helix-turn-helix domain-containing protein [Deltaproteobacteria bacterium]
MFFKRKIFAQRLRTLREVKELRQEDVGKILGITIATISKLETGKARPTVEALAALAHYYGVSMDYLAGYNRIPEDVPKWFKPLYPDLMTLGSDGRKAVKAIITSLAKK